MNSSLQENCVIDSPHCRSLILHKPVEASRFDGWTSSSLENVVVSSDENESNGVGSSGRWLANEGQIDRIRKLDEDHIKAAYNNYRDQILWAVDLERILTDVERKTTSEYLFGTINPEYLPSGFRLRHNVLKLENEKRKMGLPYADTEIFFDQQRLHKYIDPYCDFRSGMLDGCPMHSPSLPFSTGLSPLWICDKMRYLNKVDIVRRHSRSNVTFALAANRSPHYDFFKPILAKTFIVHKLVPVQSGDDGITATKDLSSNFSWVDSPQLSFDSFPSSASHAHEQIHELSSVSRFSTESPLQKTRNAKTGKRHRYRQQGIELPDGKSSGSFNIGSSGKKRYTRKGKVAGYKVTKGIDDVIVKEVRHLMGARLGKLSSSEAQLKSRWWLEGFKKSIRLIRNQLNEEYLDSLRYIYSSSQVSGELRTLRELLNYIGKPSNRYATIIVTGSFGKTIVASKIAASLVAVGFTVGLFTSLHLTSFRERITVNGRLISKSEVVHLIKCIQRAAEHLKYQPTFFECAVIIALCHFCNHRCEYVIMETGAPINLYTVHCVDRICCTAICGVTGNSCNSRSAEASRYSNLIQPHSIVVLGPTAVPFLNFKVKARQIEAIVVDVGTEPNEDLDSEHARIAEAVVTNLHIPISRQRLATGLGVRLPFRFQTLSHRDRNLAARHVHYFLKCAYNLSRAMHMQWRAIASSHPECFSYLKETDTGSIKVTRSRIQHLISKGTVAAPLPQFLTCKEDKVGPQIPSHLPTFFSSASRVFFKANQKTAFFLDVSSFSPPVTISKSATGVLVERPIRACKSAEGDSIVAHNDSFWMVRESQPTSNNSKIKSERPSIRKVPVKQLRDSDVLSKALSTPKESDKAYWIGHRESAVSAVNSWCPFNNLGNFKGAFLFLNFCSANTEGWPVSYVNRLPFKNWISEYRAWSKEEIKSQQHRIDKEQRWRLQRLCEIDSCVSSMSTLLSFQHFVAFKNEALYWNLSELLRLRETGSPYIRLTDWMQHQFSNLPHSLTEFGRTPSIARFFGASVKARVRRDELCRKKLASHYELPTPKAVILDITPNEYAFESLFHQLKKHYPATSVRICVALTDSQPVHILNSTIWRLNYHGWDTSRERTDIKGIHILQPEHHRSKTITAWLWELATNPIIDKTLKSLIISSLLTQLRWQLTLLPPLSLISTELFILLQKLMDQRPEHAKEKPNFKAGEENMKHKIIEKGELRWKQENYASERKAQEINQKKCRRHVVSRKLRFWKSITEQLLSSNETEARFITTKLKKLPNELRMSVNRLTQLFNWLKETESKIRLKRCNRIVKIESLKSPDSILNHNPRLSDPTVRCISVLPYPLLFLSTRKRFFESSISQNFFPASNDVKVFRNFLSPSSADTVDKLPKTMRELADTIQSRLLKQTIFLQRAQLFQPDPFEPISCITGLIHINYDWYLYSKKRDKKHLDYTEKTHKLKFGYSGDKIQQFLNSPSMLRVLQVQRLRNGRPMKMHALYETSVASRRCSNKQGIFTAIRHRRKTFSEMEKKLFINQIGSVKVVPVVRYTKHQKTPKDEIQRNHYTQTTYKKKANNIQLADRLFSLLHLYSLEVIGIAEINSSSVIKSTPIWIGNNNILAVSSTVMEIATNYFTRRKGSRKHKIQIVILTRSLIKEIYVFSLSGLWVSFGDNSKEIVALYLREFFKLLSIGALRRILLLARCASMEHITRKIRLVTLKQRLIKTGQPESEESEDWADESEEQKQQPWMDVGLLVRSRPNYIKNIRKSLPDFFQSSYHKNVAQHIDEDLRRPSKVADKNTLRLAKLIEKVRERSEEQHGYLDSSECEYCFDEEWSEDHSSWNGQFIREASDGLSKVEKVYKGKFQKKRMNLEFKQFAQTLQLNESTKDSNEENEFYRKNSIDFSRFDHMFRLSMINDETKFQNQFIDVIQPGDLQAQLSMIYQKAAAEQSVLLICGSPLMAREVLFTLGCCTSFSSSTDPITSAAPRITEDILTGAQRLNPELFPEGYVTISPAALARRSANAYLKNARQLRLENEGSFQSEVVRYKNERHYVT